VQYDKFDLGHNHGVAADYFALGVIVYECMVGRRPYLGRTR
jgi:DNA-binding helix-hairpin-helix protein with protein kinase domain